MPSSDQAQSDNALDVPSSDQAQGDDSLDMPSFAETGRQELQKHSQKFMKWIDPVLQNEDVEAVHKMRVASRYLRATLDAYQPACAQKPFQRVYREVKQAADLLGTARDTDVMLQHLEQQQVPENEMPGSQWLVSRLQKYRKQQQREIAAFFENFRSKRFMRLVASCIRGGTSHRGKS
jgi:CHAD domain-containing protein